MECTGLWDIKGSEGYIYAAFKNRSDEGMRQEVKLTLDLDMPWCLDALECCLQRQHFSVFGCSQCLHLKSSNSLLYSRPKTVYEILCPNSQYSFTFTFMHLADAFIQSDLHCIQVTVLHLSALVFPGNRTHDLSVASAMLYHLSYRKANFIKFMKQYPDDLLLLVRFWSVHPMDISNPEDLWMSVKQHNWHW